MENEPTERVSQINIKDATGLMLRRMRVRWHLPDWALADGGAPDWRAIIGRDAYEAYLR